MSYKKQLYYLLIAITIIKLVVASLVELGNDEVYYFTYALQPDFNHFDHPPLVGLLIRLTSLNLHWSTTLSLRIGSIASCFISSIFIFNIGKTIANEKTGFLAALIYNCSIYSGFIAGLFILPDSPQMPFWTASLLLMSKIIFQDKEKSLVYWASLGLLIGLAALCKVHGLYLWVGFGLYILIARIKWLLNWRLYIGVAITLVCLIPIVYWNIQNNFITYQFHAERVASTSIHFDDWLQEFIGEVAYQNPVIYVLIVTSVIITFKRHLFSKDSIIWLLVMSFPMIFLFWGIALFNFTLPHWNGPAYIPLYFIAAQYLSTISKRTYPIVIKVAAALILFVLLSGVILARFAPFNLGSKEYSNYGERCPTLDISGWDDFGNNFSKLVTADINNKVMKPNSAIWIGNWFPGGHILFYVASKTNQPVIGVGKITDIHKFAWTNSLMPEIKLGDDAYCIVPSNAPFDFESEYNQYFTTIEKSFIINQIRGGKMVRYFKIYRMKQCKSIPINNLFPITNKKP